MSSSPHLSGPSWRHSVIVGFTLACGGATGSASGGVVLNQIGDLSSYVFSGAPDPVPSQFFNDFPTYDCTVVEDFTVTFGELNLSNVTALLRAEGGFGAFSAVQSFRVNFFSSPERAAASIVGDVASVSVMAGTGGDATVTEVVDPGGSGEYGLVSLDIHVSLPGTGTYWVAVSPRSAVATSGQFFLMKAGTPGPGDPTGNPNPNPDANAQLANPGEGLGMGPLLALNGDYAYTVTAVPEPAAAALVIIGSLALLARRRRDDL